MKNNDPKLYELTKQDIIIIYILFHNSTSMLSVLYIHNKQYF